MGTTNIELQDTVYERLQARQRPDESFTELVDRLLDETAPDWREGFGTLDQDDVEELAAIADQSRQRTSEGLGGRQQLAIAELTDLDHDEVL